MAKEILLYGSIHDWSAESFIKNLDSAKGEDITIRINSPGGSVFSNYGMIAKLKEQEGKVQLKVDGQAASAAAFLLLYADEAEALDVSSILYHRAAYSSWIEDSKEFFTPELQASLNKVNASLRSAMEGKFSAQKWQEVTGTTLDDLFSLKGRIDVSLTAEQAKELGIINRIVKITPEKKAEINGLITAFAPELSIIEPIIESEDINHKYQKIEQMTVATLKASHPEVYEAIRQEGVSAERDRVGAFMAFAHLDLEACRKGITDGGALSQTQMAELSIKALQATQLAAIEAANPPAITTAPPDAAKTDAEQKLEAFEKEVDGLLGMGS